jgi:hypothetical protein
MFGILNYGFDSKYKMVNRQTADFFGGDLYQRLSLLGGLERNAHL